MPILIIHHSITNVESKINFSFRVTKFFKFSTMFNIIAILTILIPLTTTKIIINSPSESYGEMEIEDNVNRTNRGSDLDGKSFHNIQQGLFTDWIKTGSSNPTPGSNMDQSMDQPSVPSIIAEINNNVRGASLFDRAIIRAPWNNLAAKMFKDLATFFLDSYLVQLFGVALPI